MTNKSTLDIPIILIVDDEKDFLLLMNLLFAREISNRDFDLVFAQSAEEALQIISNYPDISIVISDLDMPEKDGIWLLNQLQIKHKAIETFVLSGHSDIQHIRATMQNGAHDYLIKPIDYKTLRAAIFQAIERWQKRQKFYINHTRLKESVKILTAKMKNSLSMEQVVI